MDNIGLKLLLLSLIVGLAATQCADNDDSPNTNTNTNTAADAGFDQDMGVVDMCRSDPPDATADPSCTENYTAIVRGTAVDQTGAPIDAVSAQMCIDDGSDFPVCLRPEPTCGDQGYFEIPIEGDDLRCVQSAVMHMIPSDSAFASSFCDIEFTGDDTVDFTIAEPVISFTTEAPTTLPPEGDATVERTVVFADGIEVDVVPERFVFFDGYPELRSRLLGSDDPLPCNAEGENFDGVVAFSPAGNIQDPGNPAAPGFPIRIPANGLAQGTTVDLFVQGSLDCALDDGVRLTEAEWVQYATATVDANGMISGARLPCFNWLAWRVQ